MTKFQGAKILKASKKDKTTVTFYPDFARFKLEGLTQSHVSLLGRRVVDVAGTVHRRVRVYFNKERIAVKDFKQYCQLYLEPDQPFVYENLHERWQVCISTSPDAEFKHISFNNNILTVRVVLM